MTLIGEKKTCSNHQERHVNKNKFAILKKKIFYGKSLRHQETHRKNTKLSIKDSLMHIFCFCKCFMISCNSFHTNDMTLL